MDSLPAWLRHAEEPDFSLDEELEQDTTVSPVSNSWAILVKSSAVSQYPPVPYWRGHEETFRLASRIMVGIFHATEEAHDRFNNARITLRSLLRQASFIPGAPASAEFGLPISVFQVVTQEDLDELYDEPALPIGGAFAPSKELTAFWIRGVKALLEEVGRSGELDGHFLDRTGPELQNEFSERLSGLLGKIGQKMRYQSEKNPQITVSGAFRMSMQLEICDRFLVRPDEGTPFLQLLSSELRHAVRKGCDLSGSWGRIILDAKGELVYVLTAPERVSDPNFVRSSEEE